MSKLQAKSQNGASPGLRARENTDGVVAAYIHEISERHRPTERQRPSIQVPDPVRVLSARPQLRAQLLGLPCAGS